MRPWRLMADQYEGNPDPDFTAYRLAGHLRYAHKASEGRRHIDSAHARRVREAHAHGLFVVHYHFARPDEGPAPKAEATLFWEAVKPLWAPGDRLALDLEPDPGKRWEAPRWYVEELFAQVERLAHQAPAVYGSSSFLREQVSVSWLRGRARWEAAYGPAPSRLPWGTHWWAWQASDGAVGPSPRHLAGIPAGDVSMLSLPLALGDRVRRARRRPVLKH